MAVSGTPWQLECAKVEQRCGYLLTSSLWSDCKFMIGSETNQEVIQAHKLILAMASPVFEAMLYGGLSEHNDPIVPIPDIQPEAFRAMLHYIYTDNITIDSFDMAWDLRYGAQKYMLPHLITECNTYISSVLCPKNVCKAYEFAHFFDDKTLKDKCLEIISTKTKEVLNDSSLEEVELNTLITVCSLDNLNVDSELDLFHAVAKYAAVEQRKQGQNSPAAEGGPAPEEPWDKVLASVESSSSQSSPAAKPTTEVDTSEQIAEDNVKEVPEPTIRAALQHIRFLSLTAQEFAEGPARSGLLTEAESFKVFMNIMSTDSAVPMPSGFSKCRERRQPCSDSEDQCFDAGRLEHVIHELKFGNPSQVLNATKDAIDILRALPNIQPALDKGILDALGAVLSEGDAECKYYALVAIYDVCQKGTPSQLRVLVAKMTEADAALLKSYCRMLAARGDPCFYVQIGLRALLKGLEQHTKVALLLKLREIGVPQLLMDVQELDDTSNRDTADKLLETYFDDYRRHRLQ